MLANNRRVRWLSASSPAQGGPETGGAIAYPVNAKGSLREIHAAQEVVEAGVGAEGCTKFWPVATQVGDAKQTKKAVGTAKVSRDALPSRPWRCKLGTKGRLAYDCGQR